MSASQSFSAARSTTASRAGVRSRSAAFNANEKGRLLGALCHGHPAHVGVDDQPQGRSHDLCTAHRSVRMLPLVNNWRGVRLASFSRNSHWSRLSSRAATNCGVSCSLIALPRINSVASRVSSTARLNTLAHEHLFHCLAHVPHLSINLSKASLRPTHIGRSEKEWRYLISVMRCPK